MKMCCSIIELSDLLLVLTIRCDILVNRSNRIVINVANDVFSIEV